MNGKRILAYLIDTAIIFIGGGVIIMPIEILVPKYISVALECILFSVFFCRDSFTGQSFGKHVMKIVVTHNGEIVSPIRGLMRNLTFIMWPVDVVLFLLRTQRLGDIWFKCTVREIEPNDEIKFRMSAITPVVAVALLMGLFYLLMVRLSPAAQFL